LVAATTEKVSNRKKTMLKYFFTQLSPAYTTNQD